jgi:hypothetical protein
VSEPTIPGRENDDSDCNPACGHRLRRLCLACGVCVDCDGCYCGED